MKKLKNLTFACLLILGLAACADDDNETPNNLPPTNEIITENQEFTAKIGEQAKNTITFTNPFNMTTYLHVEFNDYSNGEIQIDKSATKCGFSSNGQIIQHDLQIGKSCDLVYNYTPTKLDTKLLQLEIEYLGDEKSFCPTQDTIPTYEQMLARQKEIIKNIYIYSEDNNGNKSPNIINVDMGTAPYNLDSQITTDLEPQTFQITFAKDDVYQMIRSNSYHLQTDNVNCTIEGNTLTALTNEACTITVKKNTEGTLYNGSQLIIFSPNDNTKPYYNILMEVDSDIRYEKISYNFTPSYTTDYPMEDNELYVGVLENGASISKYTIDGTDKAKFKVVPTKYNGCTVLADTITIPAGQTSCYYTVELADVSQEGDFTATLDIGTNQYGISGTVDSIASRLANICKVTK